jgi:hypothetical protein
VRLNEVAWLNNVQNTQLFSLNGSLFITLGANWDGSAPKLKYFFQLSFLHVGIFLCEKDSLSARGRLEKQSNCTVYTENLSFAIVEKNTIKLKNTDTAVKAKSRHCRIKMWQPRWFCTNTVYIDPFKVHKLTLKACVKHRPLSFITIGDQYIAAFHF